MPMERGMLLRYRLSTTILLGALAAVGAVFSFARPQYRDPFPGRQFDLSYAMPPVLGWTWPNGTPGFRFGQDEGAWNQAKLEPADLTAAREAAARAGVVPYSVRVLSATRARGGDLFALVAGSGTSGRTCLGAVAPRTPAVFSCRLARHVAFVVAAPRSRELYLLGVARADVKRVALTVPGLFHATIYSRGSAIGYWWGAFGGPLEFPRPWHGRLAFYGKNGLLAAVPLSSRSPTWLLEP
jgi:hypothetical protein